MCNSHGHCAFDQKAKESYCFCDYGYGGDSCEKVSGESTSYDGHSVQVGLMSTLIAVAFAMIGGLGYMTYRVMIYRKQQTVGVYNFLSTVEMTQHNDETF